MKISRPLKILCCLIWLFIIVGCKDIDYEHAATQEIAVSIIDSLSKYEQDNNHFPEGLEDLVPLYISEIPKTIRGTSFNYRLDNFVGYYLCFGNSAKKRFEEFGCCYNPEFHWECIPGD